MEKERRLQQCHGFGQPRDADLPIPPTFGCAPIPVLSTRSNVSSPQNRIARNDRTGVLIVCEATSRRTKPAAIFGNVAPAVKTGDPFPASSLEGRDEGRLREWIADAFTRKDCDWADPAC